MACLLVPATEAVITTILTKAMEKKEKEMDANALKTGIEMKNLNRKPFSVKLKRLNNLLWGGSALLAFEHLWHGEIQPFFPFLTAAGTPADTAEMLHEMSTVGVTMAILVTCIWGIATFISYKIENHEDAPLINTSVRR
jgi:hypothetical protein